MNFIKPIVYSMFLGFFTLMIILALNSFALSNGTDPDLGFLPQYNAVCTTPLFDNGKQTGCEHWMVTEFELSFQCGSMNENPIFSENSKLLGYSSVKVVCPYTRLCQTECLYWLEDRDGNITGCKELKVRCW